MPRARKIKMIRCGGADASWVTAFVVSALILVVSVWVPPKAHAQSEDQVMAAFLYNFARYVEWPKDAFPKPNSPVQICVVGANRFGEVVTKIVSGKTVGARPVAVQSNPDLDGATDCHILFLGRDFADSHGDTIGALQGQSIFSIADAEGFALAGGIANFFRADNRIRFEINPRAARNAGLKISSKLLRLAKVVK